MLIHGCGRKIERCPTPFMLSQRLEGCSVIFYKPYHTILENILWWWWWSRSSASCWHCPCWLHLLWCACRRHHMRRCCIFTRTTTVTIMQGCGSAIWWWARWWARKCHHHLLWWARWPKVQKVGRRQQNALSACGNILAVGSYEYKTLDSNFNGAVGRVRVYRYS